MRCLFIVVICLFICIPFSGAVENEITASIDRERTKAPEFKNDSNALAHYMMGTVYDNLADTSGAIVEYKKALSYRSDLSDIYLKLGADFLGERGKPAEEVGEECALLLKKQIDSNACLDRWMADQILIYLGLAGSGKVSVSEITNHCLTNIWTIQKFLPVKIKVAGNKGEAGTITF